VDALAAFLLTGKSSALLTVTVPPPPLVPPAPAGRPARWLRPAAYVAGALALGLGALSATQALASRDGFRDAAAMVRPDGALVAGADRAGYEARIAGAEASGRNAYVSAVSAVVLGAAAGVLGYLSWDARGVPSVRF
jgi:hypothetical protein